MRLAPFLLLLLLLPALALGAPRENKWRLQFSGDAESDGEVVLVIAPRGRPAVRVAVPVRDGMGENRVARAVRNGLRDAVGEDYRIELDDGEDVLVKRRWFRPRFGVEVERISVRGVRINLDQE